MGPCRRKASLWRGGNGEVFCFPCFLQECSLVSAAWRWPERASPHPAIHRTHKDNFTGRRAFSAPRRLSPSLPLSQAHSHTHSRAVISILMDVQENMNVNKWETLGERRPGNGNVPPCLWRLLVCLDQTCSETQLDPKVLIHHTDEYKGSQTRENGADGACLSCLESLFKPGYIKLGKS